MLLGRDRERHAIDRALESARFGTSTTLGLVGEPGIGKTALLRYARERAGEMRVLRARGIQSEANIPFASLLELLRPALGSLQELPPVQGAVLETALALRPGTAQERFAVGAATLGLLAAFAEPGPVLLLVDDAQWLDGSSAQALLFALRRLIADPIAALVAVREGEPSLLDGAGLPTLRLAGLSPEQSQALLGGVSAELAGHLHVATAGNPLAMLELSAGGGDELGFAPEQGPVLLPARIARLFVRRFEELGDDVRSALVLAAASDLGDLGILQRAADRLGIDFAGLGAAEDAGLVELRKGRIEFRHPLVRSALYASAPAPERRAAHRALAAALPDRDVDRRAWHLAAAATGPDPAAAAALRQAALRARQRSAYPAAAAALERAARLQADPGERAELLLEAAQTSWEAGLADRALGLLEETRDSSPREPLILGVDLLAGQIAVARGPVMSGHAILTATAERASAEDAVAMLAEAASACFYAGRPAEMLRVAARAQETVPDDASPRTRFLAATAVGMARIIGGNAAAGAEALRSAISLAGNHPGLRDELQLLPWLAVGPIFLREADTGRELLSGAIGVARERSALSTLPTVLNLVARDQATTDQWARAEASYGEAIELAVESGQETQLAFALAGLAWLQARRGRQQECRDCAGRALELSRRLGTRLFEVWSHAALGELELGLGRATEAAGQFAHQQALLFELGISDVDLWTGPEMVEVNLRLGQPDEAKVAAAQVREAAEAKGQPWSRARALRSAGLVAEGADFDSCFEQALALHKLTPDAFERARTQLAYGERLRRTRRRVDAREQLRRALAEFERLDARPWATRARTELAATGETLRRRDPANRDELTGQEFRIALLLAEGRTTREAASALFLSPKTVEYHLHHVYMKLGIHSREELVLALAELGGD